MSNLEVMKRVVGLLRTRENSGFKCASRLFCAKVKEKPLDYSSEDNLSRLCKDYSRKKEIYLVGKDTARRTASAFLEAAERPLARVIEVNPGICRLTEALLNSGVPSVVACEANSMFEHTLQQVKNRYGDRFHYSILNFFTVYVTSYLDKTRETRGEKLFLSLGVPRDSPVCVLGTLHTNIFLKLVTLSSLFQSSVMDMKRSRFFMWMPPSAYSMYVCDAASEIRSRYYYRPYPVLFNLMFEHEIMLKAPRTDFVPAKVSVKAKTESKLKMIEMDKEHMYLVKITPKKELPCSPEHLTMLWYFAKQHLNNSSNRVIPTLEQWIPSCGVWLITGQDPEGVMSDRAPKDTDAKLPHMTIYTQFQDLRPDQILTVFKRFISWPEFENSPFKESKENHLYKSIGEFESD